MNDDDDDNGGDDDDDGGGDDDDDDYDDDDSDANFTLNSMVVRDMFDTFVISRHNTFLDNYFSFFNP